MTRVGRKGSGWAAGLAMAALAAAIQAQAQSPAPAQDAAAGASARSGGVAGFAIAAGPAAQSIAEFARQAHLTVLAATDDLAGVRTNEVHGRLSATEALARLLAGTPLAPHVKQNGSILIGPAGAGSGDAAEDAAGAGTILRFGKELRFDHTPTQAELDAIGVELPKVIVSARLSQQSAIERKKMAATAMDSIVANDAGTLPDRNIGEAISRIAGVAIGRDDFGEGVNVSIRGNGPELTGVELDGQSVRSAGGSDMNGGGDGRATEFRQLSSDLIKSVDVVKGATADMTEGSLGGAIIIKTRSSLEFDKPRVSIRAAGTQNSLNRRWDPDLNLIATRKFLHGRLGVLVNLSATTHSNESHQFQTASNAQDGAMRAIDFDDSPQKTFTYHPETVDLRQSAATTPWISYGSWNAATPLEIVTRSAAAQTKQDCYTAFPVLDPASPVLDGLSSSRKVGAINAQNRELASCLNQWNDYNPALLRYFVKRQIDERKNLDLRTDFRVNRHLTVYAKGSFSRRSVDDHFLAYSLGNVSINGNGGYTDAQGMRTALPGSGYSTFPYAYSIVSGAAPLQGAVANIDPASVVVDANHHVTRYLLQNAEVSTDQIRNHMGTNTRYLQLGGRYRAGPLRLEFLAGDMKSHFWRGDMRSGWGYTYGDATVTLLPNGIWAYSIPPGARLDDWTQVAALRPAASASAPQTTSGSPQITFSPWLRETGERTARLDLTYALRDRFPFFRRIKSGFNLRDTNSDAWGNGGYTVTPAVGTPGSAGYLPAITVPGNNLRSSFVGCQDTAGSLEPGGTPCAYGLNPTAGSRNYQIVLTPRQFQDAILGSMLAPATATRLFDGAKDRPDALIDNWTQIDVARLFGTIGAPNLNFDCMKTCTGSDGKTHEQPKTSIRERAEAAYLMADFSLDHLPFTENAFPFGWKLEGNMGARYVRTRAAGTGIMTFVSKTRTARFDPANPGAAAGYTTSQVTKNVTIDAITHDLLPSYNLAMWLVPDQVVVRYNHARTVARPGASKLIPSGTCTYDETRLDANGNLVEPMTCTSTTVGNPALQAQANINQNLSAEWYPNKDTMFSASVYRQVGKVGAPVVDGIDGATLFAGSGLVDSATGASLAGIPYSLKTYVNGQPATRTGVEFSAKTALTFLPSYLRFTGVDANVTRQHSNQTRIAWDLLSGGVLPPQGEARYSFNWALWYDDGKWQARVAVQTVGAKFNCISPCGGSPAGYTLNAYPNASLGWKYPAYNPGSPFYTDRTSYVDGKLSYRVNKALDVFIEGRNLTNQTQTTSLASAPYADGTPNLQNYYYAGRRITIGLNYRME